MIGPVVEHVDCFVFKKVMWIVTMKKLYSFHRTFNTAHYSKAKSCSGSYSTKKLPYNLHQRAYFIYTFWCRVTLLH